MATRNHNYTIDLDKPLSRQNMGLLLATGDSNGDVFNFDLTRSGTAETLSGTVTVAGYFVRNDAATVAMYGSYSGNRVSVTLPASCYVEDGYFTLAVRVTAGGAKTTIAVIDGYIRLTSTDTLIDPGKVVPSLDDVLNQIAEMEAVTAEGEATIAAIRADTDAVIENTNKATAATIAATVELAETAAPAITPTASGSIVTITDGAERPAVSVISHIDPVQGGEGDPSPDNVRPISGWDSVTAQRMGKNLIDPAMYLKASTGTTLDGDVFTTRFASGALFFNNNFCCKIKKGTYTITIIPVGTEFYGSFNFYNGKNVDTDRIFSFVLRTTGSAVTKTFTVGEDFYFTIGGDYNSGDPNYSTFSYRIMLERGESATDYETGLEGQTLSASLPETVYGGTLDWGTGVLTVGWAKYVCTGTEAWEWNNAYSRWQCNIYIGHTCVGNSDIGNLEVLCSHANTSLQSNTTGIWTVSLTAQSLGLRWKRETDNDFVSVDELKAYLAEQYAAGTPMQWVYKLATPYTIQLTPQQLNTLKGTNNVWSDTGDTDLTYIADTQLYIDQKFSALEAALLSTGANV